MAGSELDILGSAVRLLNSVRPPHILLELRPYSWFEMEVNTNQHEKIDDQRVALKKMLSASRYQIRVMYGWHGQCGRHNEILSFAELEGCLRVVAFSSVKPAGDFHHKMLIYLKPHVRL